MCNWFDFGHSNSPYALVSGHGETSPLGRLPHSAQGNITGIDQVMARRTH
jgi:hypothetical protein